MLIATAHFANIEEPFKGCHEGPGGSRGSVNGEDSRARRDSVLSGHVRAKEQGMRHDCCTKDTDSWRKIHVNDQDELPEMADSQEYNADGPTRVCEGRNPWNTFGQSGDTFAMRMMKQMKTVKT